MIAASGCLPPAIAAYFSVSEQSVLSVIASEAGVEGICYAAIGEIAARAGVSRTSVQNAVRKAKAQGLIEVSPRKRFRQPNLTNLIRIVSFEWQQWLKKHPRKSEKNKKKQGLQFPYIGYKKKNRTGKPTVILNRHPIAKPVFDPNGQPTAVAGRDQIQLARVTLS